MFIDTPPTNGGTRAAGGGGEGERICYEAFLYWYDVYGNYHEEITDEWCEYAT
jgi:hypothetical protein